MTPQQYANNLVPLALRLAGAARDESPDAINEALNDIRNTEAPPGTDPLATVAVFLAAAINPDATPLELWGWTHPTEPEPDVTDWRAAGACRSHPNPDLFYPEDFKGVRAAQAICRDCPVKTACLEHALTADERYGVWGGTSERERRRIVQQRNKVEAAA